VKIELTLFSPLQKPWASECGITKLCPDDIEGMVEFDHVEMLAPLRLFARGAIKGGNDVIMHT
jgi:hypothetical protein